MKALNKRRYEPLEVDAARVVLRNCGLCHRRGIGRTWTQHWRQKSHRGQERVGTVFVWDYEENREQEVDLQEFEEDLKKRVIGDKKRRPAEVKLGSAPVTNPSWPACAAC